MNTEVLHFFLAVPKICSIKCIFLSLIGICRNQHPDGDRLHELVKLMHTYVNMNAYYMFISQFSQKFIAANAKLFLAL